MKIPLHIVSVQNESTHWRAVGRRRKAERQTVLDYICLVHKLPEVVLPCIVTLTRIAPRKLDSHDNLRAGFKGPVDAIATWIGVKDNDPRVTWEYRQEKGEPFEYACRIEFGPAFAEAA